MIGAPHTRFKYQLQPKVDLQFTKREKSPFPDSQRPPCLTLRNLHGTSLRISELQFILVFEVCAELATSLFQGRQRCLADEGGEGVDFLSLFSNRSEMSGVCSCSVGKIYKKRTAQSNIEKKKKKITPRTVFFFSYFFKTKQWLASAE